MEPWQLAAIFDAHRDEGPAIDPELWEREKDTLAERAAKIRGEREAPEVRVTEAGEIEVTAQIMRQMGITTE